MPNFNNYFSLPAVKLAVFVAGGLILAALIFDAGVDVGMQRGHPGPGRPGFMAFGVPLPHAYITNGHGAVGEVSIVGTSSITIAEPDGDSEDVFFTDGMMVETPQGPTTTGALMAGTHVIIIGSPDESHEHIYAKFIRVVPTPPQQ